MKFKTIALLVMLMVIFWSCSSDSSEDVINIGNGSDVIVTVNINHKMDIEKIEFLTHQILNKAVIRSAELRMHNTIKYGLECGGEGTFKVCIYTKSDTICSEYYIEKGYSPVLSYSSSGIEEIESIGRTY